MPRDSSDSCEDTALQYLGRVKYVIVVAPVHERTSLKMSCNERPVIRDKSASQFLEMKAASDIDFIPYLH